MYPVIHKLDPEQAEKYNNYQYSQGTDKYHHFFHVLFVIITIATFDSR
jgi:hypothetical protein